MEEGVNNQDGEGKEIIAQNEDEGVIHRDITENEREINRNTLNKVREEIPDDSSPVEMDKGVLIKMMTRMEKMIRKKRKMKQQIMKAPQLVKLND